MLTHLLCQFSLNGLTAQHHKLAPAGLRVPLAPLEGKGTAQQSHVLVEGGLHRGALRGGEGRGMVAPDRYSYLESIS